jgi:hypothetical protein
MPKRARTDEPTPRPTEPATPASPSRRIDERIRELGGWRGKALARMRQLICAADPAITEQWKWGGPVWECGGLICTGEAYAKAVKLTFAHGAALPDPKRLFNAIDIHEGEQVDGKAFQALVRAAAAHNGAPAQRPKANGNAKANAKAKVPAKGAARPGAVKLLSGGNPQIAKADGDAPVQAYIAAMPGWKRGFGERLDALIGRQVPGVQKAVKWNSPFYGLAGQGWFLSLHVFTRYVKVSFFRGTSLRPVPSGGTPKSQEVRWVDVYEDDAFDESQWADWLVQAAALPGWVP